MLAHIERRVDVGPAPQEPARRLGAAADSRLVYGCEPVLVLQRSERAHAGWCNATWERHLRPGCGGMEGRREREIQGVWVVRGIGVGDLKLALKQHEAASTLHASGLHDKRSHRSPVVFGRRFDVGSNGLVESVL